MRLPWWLLEAIVRVTPDQAAAEDLARRWRDVLSDLVATADVIRRQVAASRCRCALAPPAVDDRGRCTRCWGRRS